MKNQAIETRIRRLEIAVFGSTDTKDKFVRPENSFRNQSPHDVNVYALWDSPRSTQLTANFQLGEFACNDGSPVVLVHPVLLSLLENIRAWADSPILINSGYRTPSYNEAIGGGDESAHMLGMAADIVTETKTATQIARYADRQLKCGGVGYYNDFTHVDVYGSNRRW